MIERVEKKVSQNRWTQLITLYLSFSIQFYVLLERCTSYEHWFLVVFWKEGEIWKKGHRNRWIFFWNVCTICGKYRTCWFTYECASGMLLMDILQFLISHNKRTIQKNWDCMWEQRKESQTTRKKREKKSICFNTWSNCCIFFVIYIIDSEQCVCMPAYYT